MNQWRAAAEIARWEFQRYVKPKQQVIGVLIALGMMLGGTFVARLARGGEEDRAIELAVVGAETLDLPAQLGRFRIARHSASALGWLRREVQERRRNAVLVLHDSGSGELIARQAPPWSNELTHELTARAVRLRLDASGLDPQRLAEIQAPFALTVREAAPRAGWGERIAVFVALGLMGMALFTGLSYIFVSVTGEKRNRLAEQVISAISPQAWIDGKILGLSGVAIVGILNLIVAGLIYLGLRRLLWGESIPLPTSIERPFLLLAALVIISLGFFFWFTFVTAIASIIDDPQNSNRNQLAFLPMLAMVPAFLAVGKPNAAWIRTLSILPPTSAGVLPARLLVTDVPWREATLSTALLIGAILVLRRLAGRIFRLGMLMYGKEPSWAEVRRWMREAG